MKIIRMEAENVKRIRAVEITPEGSLVMIGGDNAQGKSSVLDSIMCCLGGKRYDAVKMVHDGKKKGFIDLDCGDYKIRRTFTEAGGGVLTVTGKDGTRMASPQAVLDSLVGSVSFDPLSFAGANDTQQGEMIKDLAGLDLSDIDTRRKETYEERTMVNRDTRRYETEHLGLVFNDAPEFTWPLAIEDIVAEIRANNASIQEISEINVEIENDVKTLIADANREEVIAKEIKHLQQEAKDIVSRRAVIDKEIAANKKAIAKKEKATFIPEVLEEKLKNIEDHNKIVRANETFTAALKKVTNSHDNSEALTKKISDLDAERDKMIKAAAMPISGLSFNDAGLLLYQGIPFSQASDAEKIRVSVAIGIAMNPELKVLMIRNGSLLDDKNLKMVAKMAELKDSQLWVETVGKREGCSVIMEDGFSRDPEQ